MRSPLVFDVKITSCPSMRLKEFDFPNESIFFLVVQLADIPAPAPYPLPLLLLSLLSTDD